MSRYARVAALAIGLSMAMTPVVSGAAAPAPDDSARAQSAKGSDQVRGNECVTRNEYRKLVATGKNATMPRQARRIIGDGGKRASVSRAAGSKWEIRKYLQCNSEIRHVYVNYRDNVAYRKAW